jgi:hypothetical protein
MCSFTPRSYARLISIGKTIIHNRFNTKAHGSRSEHEHSKIGEGDID